MQGASLMPLFIIVFTPAAATLISLLSRMHSSYMRRVSATSHQQSYIVSRVWPSSKQAQRPTANRAALQSRRPRRAAVLRMCARDGILNAANTNASVSPKWPQLSAYGTYATRCTRQLPTNRSAASTLSLSLSLSQKSIRWLVPATLDHRWRSTQLVCMHVNANNKVFISFVFYSYNRNVLTPCKNVLNRYENAFWQQVQMCCVCVCVRS